MKKGEIAYSLDFGKIGKGKVEILKLEITGEETVTPENKDQAPFEVYTYISNGEDGKVAKEFADIKLKASKQELVDEVKKNCEDYIEKCNDSIKRLKDSIKMNKSIIKQLNGK